MNREELIAATARLKKRLGGERTQQAIAAIQAGDLATAVEMVLDYYDRTYLFDLQRREVPIYSVPVNQSSALPVAQMLQQQARQVMRQQKEEIVQVSTSASEK
jgi:tRNA 2-selenouridine synthase